MICPFDQAYLKKINRNKIHVILNNLLIFGLEKIFVDDFYVEEKQDLYLNWLIAKKIQVQYFSNQKLSINNILINQQYNINSIFKNIHHLDFSDSNITNDNIYTKSNQKFKNIDINKLSKLNL